METYAQTDMSRDYASTGSSSLGQVRGNDLGTIKSELERHVQRVREIRVQAGDIGDSIFGARPQSPATGLKMEADAPAFSVTALLSELDDEISMLSSAIGRF